MMTPPGHLPRKHENRAVLTPNPPSRLRAPHAPERRSHAMGGLGWAPHESGVTRPGRRKPGWLGVARIKWGKGGARTLVFALIAGEEDVLHPSLAERA